VPRADEGSHRLPLWCDELLLEGDALVAFEHRFADTDEAVAIADGPRDALDLVAAGLALTQRAAEALEGLLEEAFDVVRLQASGFGSFHFLAHALHAARVHRVLGEGLVLQEVLELSLIEGALHGLIEPRPHVRALAVADRLHQEFAKGAAFELDLAQHVEDLAAECLAGFFELFEQAPVDVALARLVGDEVPQVADLRLTDAVDAAEALFEPIGIPGQVVVHHQVGALEVDALARCVRCDQHVDLRIVLESLLGLLALLPAHLAMDDDNGSRAAQDRLYARCEVVQGVSMLGEDDELLVGRGLGAFVLAVFWAAFGCDRCARAGPDDF
jgi:hypothetical protein